MGSIQEIYLGTFKFKSNRIIFRHLTIWWKTWAWICSFWYLLFHLKRLIQGTLLDNREIIGTFFNRFRTKKFLSYQFSFSVRWHKMICENQYWISFVSQNFSWSRTSFSVHIYFFGSLRTWVPNSLLFHVASLFLYNRLRSQ